MAFLFSGCSTNKDVNTKENDNKQSPENDSTLIITRLSDAENLDHHFMSTINAASTTHRKIYEGLVGRDKNAEIKPLQAKECEQLDDVTWEFSLGTMSHSMMGQPSTQALLKTPLIDC
jgi:peptide/nickel transport system substrate-binding protein